MDSEAQGSGPKKSVEEERKEGGGEGREAKETRRSSRGGTLAKETWGSQAQCQFLRELEQDSIDSIRLLLGKEEASGPSNLPGRPGGRLPELGISGPTPRGRT